MNHGARKRSGWSGWVVALLACTQAATAVAETADERLQRLENEIGELRQLLREQRETASLPEAQSSAKNGLVVPVQNGAVVRYYIGNEPLGAEPPAGATPTVEGRISDPESLSFDPAGYDVADAGLFSDYRDPASYRYVGVALEGDLPVYAAGEYEFVLHPKPAREGGANVSTRLSVWLSIDGRPAVEVRGQSSWRLQRGRLQLEPGLHRLRIWAVADSDGFGPSPTATRLLLAVKGPGDASPRPLRDLRPTTD